MTNKENLQILIVGAGIAGLAAAVTLRRQGHRVMVSAAFRSRYSEQRS